MEFFLFWLIGAVIVGIGGSARGRSGFGWFLLGLVISPLLALVLLLVLPSRTAAALAAPAPSAAVAASSTPEISAATHRRCPECAEWILKEARKCKHCGSAVAPEATTPTPMPKPAHTEVDYDRDDLAAVPVAQTFLFRTNIEEIFGRTAPQDRERLRASLARDVANKLDPNAVRVSIDNRPVGFLPDAVASGFEARARKHFNVGSSDPLPAITVPAAMTPDPRGSEKLLSLRLPRPLVPPASH